MDAGTATKADWALYIKAAVEGSDAGQRPRLVGAPDEYRRSDIDVTIVAVLTNTAKALEAVERLQAGPPRAR